MFCSLFSLFLDEIKLYKITFFIAGLMLEVFMDLKGLSRKMRIAIVLNKKSGVCKNHCQLRQTITRIMQYFCRFVYRFWFISILLCFDMKWDFPWTKTYFFFTFWQEIIKKKNAIIFSLFIALRHNQALLGKYFGN